MLHVLTTILELGLLALGLQLVPLRPERAVVGVEHVGEGHLDLAKDVVGEVAVLVEHGDEELVLEVPDPEGELLVPGGVERLPQHLGLGPLLAQLRPGVGVPRPVGVRRQEAPGLDHAHHQPHLSLKWDAFLSCSALLLFPRNSIRASVRLLRPNRSNPSSEKPRFSPVSFLFSAYHSGRK